MIPEMAAIRRAPTAGERTLRPARREPFMDSLMLALLLAPLAGTLAGVGCRRARRAWRRWAQ